MYAFQESRAYSNNFSKYKLILLISGPSKFQIDDLRPALSYCTHLVYGYAGLNAENHEAVPLNPHLDTGTGYAFYQLVLQLKSSFPDLKVYLSIGGNADPYEETHKYLTVVSHVDFSTSLHRGIRMRISLGQNDPVCQRRVEKVRISRILENDWFEKFHDQETSVDFKAENFSVCMQFLNFFIVFESQTETPEARTRFINSVVRLLNVYKFDGIDLAWQFPEVKVKKQRGTFGSLWHGIKKTFGYAKFKDDKETEHREGFTALVRDLKTQLRSEKKALTLTVLPHVNATGEFSN